MGEQAQSACFSPDGEVIVVGTITGKWVVLSAATREVFSVNQVSKETRSEREDMILVPCVARRAEEGTRCTPADSHLTGQYWPWAAETMPSTFTR